MRRGTTLDLDALAQREGCRRHHVEGMLGYAFLGPDLMKALADGRLPCGVSATALADALIGWLEQWRMIGVAMPAGRIG